MCIFTFLAAEACLGLRDSRLALLFSAIELGQMTVSASPSHTVVIVPTSTPMVSVTGARDELIRVIEKSFADSVILVRGNEITIDGPKPSVELIETLISEMLVMLRTGQGLTPESVERSIAMLRSDVRPADVLTANIISSRGRTIRAKTLNQKRYVDAIVKTP